MAVTLNVFRSSTKLVTTSWELLKGLMNAYLHGQAPKLKSFHNLVLALATCCFIPPAD